MSAREILGSLGSVSPTICGIGRAYDIGAAVVPTTPGTAIVPAAEKKPSLMQASMRFAPGALGAGAGYFVWKKHRVLGALAGHALVQCGYDAYKGDTRRALCEAVVEGAGVAGAYYHKKIPGVRKSPVLGWVAGILAGSVATYFVSGSPARDEWSWLKSKVA